MTIEIEFRDEEDYLRASCRGIWEPDSVSQALERIRDKAALVNHRRILIDWCSVSPPKTEFYRYLIGENVAQFLANPLKVVMLFTEEKVNKFAENTAVNRGANFRVAARERDALQWLLEELPVKA